jgi:hypothetical protein
VKAKRHWKPTKNARLYARYCRTTRALRRAITAAVLSRYGHRITCMDPYPWQWVRVVGDDPAVQHWLWRYARYGTPWARQENGVLKTPTKTWGDVD